MSNTCRFPCRTRSPEQNRKARNMLERCARNGASVRPRAGGRTSPGCGAGVIIRKRNVLQRNQLCRRTGHLRRQLWGGHTVTRKPEHTHTHTDSAVIRCHTRDHQSRRRAYAGTLAQILGSFSLRTRRKPHENGSRGHRHTEGSPTVRPSDAAAASFVRQSSLCRSKLQTSARLPGRLGVCIRNRRLCCLS